MFSHPQVSAACSPGKSPNDPSPRARARKLPGQMVEQVLHPHDSCAKTRGGRAPFLARAREEAKRQVRKERAAGMIAQGKKRGSPFPDADMSPFLV
jgi:hypothetical protein